LKYYVENCNEQFGRVIIISILLQFKLIFCHNTPNNCLIESECYEVQENQILYQSANLRKKIAVVLMIIMIVISSITVIIGIIETWVLSGEVGSASVNMLSDTA